MTGAMCCVANCHSKSHDTHGIKLQHGLRFFCFPTWKRHTSQHVADVTRRRRIAWIAAVRRKDLNFDKISPAMKVCSLHFHSGAPSYEMFENHPDWKPSLNLGHKEVKPTDLKRFERCAKRRAKKELPRGPEKLETNFIDPGEYTVVKVDPDEFGPTFYDAEGHSDIKEEPEEYELTVVDTEEYHEVKVDTDEYELSGVEPMMDPGEHEIHILNPEEHPDDYGLSFVDLDENQMVPPDELGLSVVEEQEQPSSCVKGHSTTNRKVKLSRKQCAFCRPRQALINSLLDENRRLKQELEKHKMNEEFLAGDDTKVKYYTGLPSFKAFQVLLGKVLPFLREGKRRLKPFQMVLLTLMRLRLDMSLKHLSEMFQVHRTTLGSAFHETISILYAQLYPLVYWPDRDHLLSSMPQEFVEAFGERVIVIVDCLKIFIMKPTSPTEKIWAQYEGNRTLRYLIVITPQGVVCLISKVLGEDIRNKQLIEQSGFLDKLLPGDVVFADGRCKLRESVGVMCAQVTSPESSTRSAELNALNVDVRTGAHLQIHVERITSAFKNKYKILHSKNLLSTILPRKGEEVSFLDKIVKVCCALCNVCPQVI